MLQQNISKEFWDVSQNLSSLGLTKDELIQVVHRVVAARNEAVAIDPINTPGQLAYQHGVRALRELLIPKGWAIDRTEHIESIINEETGLKIIYQNTDSAANKHREPKAISGKGPAVKRMIENATPFLFSYMNDEEEAKRNTKIWFFCVAVKGDNVTAELSCPRSIHNKQFSDFSSRIFIVHEGEWDVVNLSEDHDENNEIQEQEFEVNISKK